jgi:hypothetical protein
MRWVKGEWREGDFFKQSNRVLALEGQLFFTNKYIVMIEWVDGEDGGRGRRKTRITDNVE